MHKAEALRDGLKRLAGHIPKGGQNLEKKNNTQKQMADFGKKSLEQRAQRKPVQQKASSFAEYEAMMNERKKAEKAEKKQKLRKPEKP
ncbi:MAG: hypothetical protein ACI4KH_04115, partial [Oscillospiraceae bacterium]